MKPITQKGALIAALALFFVSNSSQSQPVSQTFSAAGNHTYIIPTGWTATIKVEAWGAGGGGGGNSFSLSGGGGGGGAYASKTLTLSAGNYSVVVGSGGVGANRPATSGGTAAQNGGNSTFGGSSVIANGGFAGGSLILGFPSTDGAGGAGGVASIGPGYTSHSGGTGGKALVGNANGGGGGGSAWASASGNNGGNSQAFDGGPGGTGEGTGGEGGSAGDPAGDGYSPGAGGGGKFISTAKSGNGADGQVKITVISSLPVHFGPFAAELANNVLAVSFTTLQETNNDHFNLQSSQNGVDFTTIATIQSKHADGNASGSTTYQLTLDIAGKISFALSLFALLGIGVLGFNRKTRVLMAALFLMGVAGFIVSCTKNTNELASKTAGKAFLRIEQVDKNGHSSYSKVITISKE